MSAALVSMSRSGGDPGWRRFSHEAMATVFEVCAEYPDQRYASQATHAAFELVDRLERDLSRFLPNSDISRVNRLTAGAATRVTPSTMECLVIARHAFDLTGGTFDVSIGTGLSSLELDTDDCLVRATLDRVTLDLGGIGKGYAVDRMAALLDEWGIARAVVHGGFSSVLVLDAPAGLEAWPLTMSDPEDASRVLARLSLQQTALGASGLRKGGHIVDPRTGKPASGRRAAWVALPRPRGARTDAADGPQPRAAALADALATACLLMRVAEIERLCRSNPGLRVWILSEPDETAGEATLRRFGGAGPGYTATAR